MVSPITTAKRALRAQGYLDRTVRTGIPKAEIKGPKETRDPKSEVLPHGTQIFIGRAATATFQLAAANWTSWKHYIDSQEQHHRVLTFQQEYRILLKKYRVEFDERYVWD